MNYILSVLQKWAGTLLEHLQKLCKSFVGFYHSMNFYKCMRLGVIKNNVKKKNMDMDLQTFL